MGLLGRHSIFPGFNASAGRGFHDVCPRTGRDRQVLLSLFQHDAFRIWEFFPCGNRPAEYCLRFAFDLRPEGPFGPFGLPCVKRPG